MKYKMFLLFISLITYHTTIAQEVTCSPKDKNIFATKIADLKTQYTPEATPGEIITMVGKTFLGTPYVAKTLEVGTTESLVVNLQGLDCTTYVENVLAFSLMLLHDKSDFETYLNYLEKIRYRDGKLDGYTSRLHYFSEWITNNEKKGIIENITGDIGGIELQKQINFMSTHRDLYPFLKDDENYKGIQQSEINIDQSVICYLPKDQIALHEKEIISGDIIALTTSIKGLDITHTGIAIREKDGRIHLLHASSKGQVEISKLPLVDYLKKIKNNTGIIVNRVL